MHAPSPATATRATGLVKHLDHLNFTVKDIAASAAWYGRLFDFTVVERGRSHGTPYAILRSGEALLCIYEHPELAHAVGDDHAARGLHHLSHFGLRITDEADWERRMAAEGDQLELDGPYHWPHSTAWYVADPTGYIIEVASWTDDQVAFG